MSLFDDALLSEQVEPEHGQAWVQTWVEQHHPHRVAPILRHMPNVFLTLYLIVAAILLTLIFVLPSFEWQAIALELLAGAALIGTRHWTNTHAQTTRDQIDQVLKAGKRTRLLRQLVDQTSLRLTTIAKARDLGLPVVADMLRWLDDLDAYARTEDPPQPTAEESRLAEVYADGSDDPDIAAVVDRVKSRRSDIREQTDRQQATWDQLLTRSKYLHKQAETQVDAINASRILAGGDPYPNPFSATDDELALTGKYNYGIDLAGKPIDILPLVVKHSLILVEAHDRGVLRRAMMEIGDQFILADNCDLKIISLLSEEYDPRQWPDVIIADEIVSVSPRLIRAAVEGRTRLVVADTDREATTAIRKTGQACRVRVDGFRA